MKPHLQNSITGDHENPTQFASYDTNLKIVGRYDETTLKLFGALEGAYNYFRKELFNNGLPPVVLTLNRNSRSMGYYMPHAWLDDSRENIPEINISPRILALPPIEVMQTLVHEMCHHFQKFYGKPSSRGYHNVEFSEIMFSIGLMCSTTGKSGGKITGRHMSDYVLEGGIFEKTFHEMPEEYLLPFTPYSHDRIATIINPLPTGSAHVNKNKYKYCCNNCHLNVWGKPDLHIICGNCQSQLIVVSDK